MIVCSNHTITPNAAYLSYYKYNITGPPSYWVNIPITALTSFVVPGANTNMANVVDMCLDLINPTQLNVWIEYNGYDFHLQYIQINTWAAQSIPETTTTLAGNNAVFGGSVEYNKLTTYNAQANFNYPTLYSFTYNNNFQVMTATGQINTNVNYVISVGTITLTLPNATNAKIGQIIHIYLGPNTATAQYPTIIIPDGSNMKMCIGQNTGGVTTYTFVVGIISLKLMYIGSLNASTTLYWIVV